LDFAKQLGITAAIRISYLHAGLGLGLGVFLIPLKKLL